MKKKKSKKKQLRLTILCIVLDLLAIGGFVMMYGPWKGVRNLYINTAMKTKDHKYFANIFYSQKTIDEVMASNYFVEIKEEVKLDDVIIDTAPKDKYDNEYDKEILNRDGNNNDYKVINLKYNII